ncbi:MAG: 50S ribosomal protein L25/general stress protein Ctc [Rikenellaceae bacterium]
MKNLEIAAKKREDFGKKASKAVRYGEGVPCVVYGGGDTVHFSVDKADLRQLIYTPNSYIVNFDIEGAKETVVMREVQYHPVTDEPIHIDFYRVIAGKPITIDLPVKLYGNAEGVKLGGKLQLSKRKIRVSGLEEHLPDSIDIDVTELALGKSIFVGDLSVENLTMLTPATTAICAVRMTRAARGAAAAAAAAAKK